MRDAVDQLMQQVKDQKQQSKAEELAERERSSRRTRVRLTQVSVLAVVLLISILFAIPEWRQPFDPPAGAQAVHDARRAVVFAAQLVESHIRANRRAPATFQQLGVPIAGIEYRRLDSLGYVISITVEGRTLSFRRGDDARHFLAEP